MLIRSFGWSASSPLSPLSDSSLPDPSPLRTALPSFNLRFFLRCLFGTSLKSANRSMISASTASALSTLEDSRAFA